jgi:hypothetical protein
MGTSLRYVRQPSFYPTIWVTNTPVALLLLKKNVGLLVRHERKNRTQLLGCAAEGGVCVVLGRPGGPASLPSACEPQVVGDVTGDSDRQRVHAGPRCQGNGGLHGSR